MSWREKVALCMGVLALVAMLFERQPAGVHVAFLQFLIPAAAGLVGGVIKNRQQSKAKQAAFDAEQRDLANQKQQFDLYERPKLEAQQRRASLRSMLSSAIARAAGLDKALPGFFASGSTPYTPGSVANPFEGVSLGKRPGGFSWGSLLGDAANVGAQTYGAVRRDKDIGVAFPAGNEQDRARVRLGLPPSGSGSFPRRTGPDSVPNYVPPDDRDEFPRF